MNTDRRAYRLSSAGRLSGFFLIACVVAACAVLGAPSSALARQDDAREGARRDELGRRVTNGKTTVLAFKGVTVEKIIPFIVESTGKVVLPVDEIMRRKITIINDEPIPQRDALDLVFLALQQNGVAVVETEDLILLRDIAEIVRQDVPVISAETTTLTRRDLGTVAEKVYRLSHSSAKAIGEMLEDSVPDYAKLAVDEGSNQVVVRGNIGLLQRIERLIISLDRPPAGALITKTFRLRFADAEQVAENITELFEEEDTRSQGNRQQDRFSAMFTGRGGRGGSSNDGGGGAGTSANLRVTANTQQNSVTVLAEPGIVEQIEELIERVWDQPLDEDTVVPRIYDLQNSDPIKVQDLLEGLFGTPSSGDGGTGDSQGVGRLAGQFSFQAIPEAGRLVVVAKSPDNLFVIDEIIAGIDRPQTAGLPDVIELKHANAEELAEQLNSLLAQDGTLASIPRVERDLSSDDSSDSPFAADGGDGGDDGANDNQTITFWWQRSSPPTDHRESSNLVGRIRLVPVWRQNAVMVLAPPEYRASVEDLIRQLDKPGRQVLISAVIVEVTLEDALSLGLRWGSDSIDLNNSDNSISVGTTTTGQENNFLGDLFNTSMLNINTDLNLVLQALQQDTTINILSEPKIFTSDNQEAVFFDGQDIPFVTDSQVTDTGNQINSFDYRAVGIQLRVLPRITANRLVDLRVNLELSSIQPDVTTFGAFVVDRRETTTQLIVQDGQTIVISGILRNEDTDVHRKVPFLGDIPLLGLLFRSTERVTSTTELVAFITPTVIDNYDELERLNDPYRNQLDRLRDEFGAPAIEKEEDAVGDAATSPADDAPQSSGTE